MRTGLTLLGLLLVAVVLLVLLVPGLRSGLIGRLRNEPFHAGQPASHWISELKDSDADKRRDAIMHLSVLLGNKDTTGPAIAPEAVPALQEVARKDEDANARKEAVEALSHCLPYRDDLVLFFLEKFSDEGRLVRVEAAQALGNAGSKDPKVIAALVRGLAEQDDHVGRILASALVKLSPESIPPLIEALADEDYYRRKQAGDTLVKIGDPAEGPLTKALGDQNYDRQHNAKICIQEIRQARERAKLDEESKKREEERQKRAEKGSKA